MGNLIRLPKLMQPPASPDRWKASMASQQVASMFESADQALRYPDPSLSRPACYRERAEEGVGLLQPVVRETAVVNGARLVLADLDHLTREGLTDGQREDAVICCFRRALAVYHATLGGRLVIDGEMESQEAQVSR